jgi:DNA-binding MarR family transcriptional regulator
MSPSRGQRLPTPLMEEVGTELSRLLASARAITTEAAARFHPDLQPAAFHVARWLLAFGPARTGDIARGVAMDRSAVSRLVDGLQSAGLVRVDADASDRRANLVQLTPAARKQIIRSLAWKGGVLHDRLASFGDEDLKELARLLAKLNET